jgi:two-component system sensor histidine kinase VicK
MHQQHQPYMPNEEQSRIMVDHAPVLIWISGADNIRYSFNAGWLNYTGKNVLQEQDKGWTEGVHPDDLERCLSMYLSNFNARSEYKIEYRLRRHDGQFRWVTECGVPRFTSQGSFEGYVGSCLDIHELLDSLQRIDEGNDTTTLEKEQALNEELAAANEELSAVNEELQQSQESLNEINQELEQRVAARVAELSESEGRFRNMAESSEVLIAVADETANGTYFNKAWVELTGKTEKELLEFGWSDLIHPEDRERWISDYLAAAKNQESFGGEFRMRNKEGQYRWLWAKIPPRFRPDGTFAGYISSCIDITERKEQELQMMQVLNMLPASVVIIRGPELVVESINDANLSYWKRTREQVIGKRFLEILPDLADQPFAGQLRQVMDTGGIIDVKESPVIFEMPDGSHRETYVDYSYQPLTDGNGKHTGVLVMSFEITERVTARKLLESYTAELQSVNNQLTDSNRDLALSEARFKYLIQEAPVAIGVLNGRKLIVESANQKILEVWGKTTAIIGLPLEVALPELEGQPFLGLLDEVYTSGKPFYANEIRALLEHEGILREFFFNVVYQPIQVEGGPTTDILVVAVDVTEQVTARKKVEQAELTLRLAIEAANMGTWNLHPDSRELTFSKRLKELFGFKPEEEPTMQDLITQITDDYRDSIVEAFENAIAYGGKYDVSYTILSHEDQKERWLRALGNLNKDISGKYNAFTGVIMDITEQKQDEQRKNDFIGMVSHELKTPLTSLNAYLQMLNGKAQKSGDQFTAGALDKSLNQVKKMTTMINGFLNVSRLESGKIYIDKQQFDLAELVKEVEEETIALVSSHHVVFAPVNRTDIVGDRDKIGQVINNFISNAVKYSPGGSTIQVACVSVNNTALVSVKDEGFGIKPEDQQKLFDRYYRVEEHHTKTIAGFGIGLYLCAEIIQRHNGKIWVNSEVGGGSTFNFSLPLD